MTSTAKQTEEATTPSLGKEGAPCSECGKPLAADQRYCLNCGHRRGEPRVDLERHLLSGGEGAAVNGRAPAAGATGRAWSPLAAVGLIALLGIMLLVGVLIGMEDSDDEQTTTGTAPAQGATPTATAPAATPPAATTPPATPPPATPTPTTPPAGSGTAAPTAPGGGAGAGAGNAPGLTPEAEAPIGPRGTP
jgi:hypothetical protein